MLAIQRATAGDGTLDHASDDDAGPTVDIVPFEAWHLMQLNLQPSQLSLSYTLTMEHGTSLVKAGPCYSAMVGVEVIACAGVIEFWPGRSQAWALLSDVFPAHVKSVHKAVRDFMRSYKVDRLECVIDPRNENTIRWAEHLGFEYESTMRRYTPSGDTQVMMVRI